MKASREQAAENRERIVETAARLFRERGFEGIGVSDLMKAAGLTHGGFYGHFSSKEDLMAEACTRALAQSLTAWRKQADEARSDGALLSIARHYLSGRHRDNPGGGCAVAALGADASRHGPIVRQAIAGGIRSGIDVLTKLVHGRSAAQRRQRAIGVHASLVGAIVMARSVDDPALSKEILEAALASVSELQARRT